MSDCAWVSSVELAALGVGDDEVVGRQARLVERLLEIGLVEGGVAGRRRRLGQEHADLALALRGQRLELRHLGNISSSKTVADINGPV